MKRNTILVLLIFIFTIILVGCSSTDRQGQSVELQDEIIKEDNNENPSTEVAAEIAIGELAPNFTLKNLNDEEVSLEDFRGNIVLLNFWATWCKYCDMEMPDLQKLDRENDDLIVLAIDFMEDKETVEEYINKGGYEFQVLLDEKGKIAKTYLVSGFPTSYFIDEDGILLKGVPGALNYDQMVQILESIRENK